MGLIADNRNNSWTNSWTSDFYMTSDFYSPPSFVSAPSPPNQSWFDALGKPVPAAQRQAALDLLTKYGQDPGEASMVLTVVCREIEHDEPNRAQQYLRSWLPSHGSETLLLRTLAVLTAPIFPDTYRDDLLALRDELTEPN